MSQDELLTTSDREEALSRAYLQAVAAHAGYVVADDDFDRDGIDCLIRAGGRMRPALGVQLKATVNLGEAREGCYRYPLKRRNYDLLREPTQTPRVLVVLALPEDETQWLTVTVDHLILRRCAYWVSLAELPETENHESVTISLPTHQCFDGVALHDLMERSRRGAIR